MSATKGLLRFQKMHAAGNVLLLFDARETGERDWPQLALATADPHRAVGHDGVLVVSAGKQRVLEQRMFNPDGSEDMCGNGLRCTAKYLCDEGDIGKQPVSIATIAGPRSVHVLSSQGSRASVRAELGGAHVRDLELNWRGKQAQAVPATLRRELAQAVFVDLGTPHLVIVADGEPTEAEWRAASAFLERHSGVRDLTKWAEARTSVTWLFPQASDRARVRVWERAIGETLSCGTGAAAALAAGQRRGVLGEAAQIASPGGTLEAARESDGTLWVTGPAETICEGWWPVGS